MVNGLHLYSAFTDPMATKALYILPHIHPFTYTPTLLPSAQVSSIMLNHHSIIHLIISSDLTLLQCSFKHSAQSLIGPLKMTYFMMLKLHEQIMFFFNITQLCGTC